MATQVQLRGGTTTEHSTFTGAVREVTVDTDKDVLVVHDGSTAGGKPMLGSGGGTLTGDLSLGDGVKVNGLEINTTATSNIGLGTGAVDSITTGDYNVGVGDNALTANTEGVSNTATGYYSLCSNTTGSNNTANGLYSLYYNTTGVYNTASGGRGLYANTTGSYNTATGQQALQSGHTSTAGDFVVGTTYVIASVGTTDFTAIGASANTVGVLFVATGVGSGTGTAISRNTGDNNTATGYRSLRYNTTGSNNTALGYQAGDNITTGSSNIIIGSGVDAPSTTGDNQLNIGGWITRNSAGDLNLTHGTATKLATTSTGIDVTGTVTADGLTVDGDINFGGQSDITWNTGLVGGRIGGAGFFRADDDTTTPYFDIGVNAYQDSGGWKRMASGYTQRIYFDSSDGNVEFWADTTGAADSAITGWQRTLTVGETGDISFYDSTGNTPKFHWDAADERLGIGTSNPASALDVNGKITTRKSTSAYEVAYHLRDTDGDDLFRFGADGVTGEVRLDACSDSSNDHFTFYTSSTEAMRIDSSGNVGIGVTPESWKSDSTGWAMLQLGDGGGVGGRYNSGNLELVSNAYRDVNNNRWEYIGTNGSEEAAKYTQHSGQHVFYTAPSGTADTAISWTTAMTINNSGEVHTGTFSLTGASYGAYLHDGLLRTSRTGTGVQPHHRFYNANGLVGNISTSGSSTAYNTSSDYRLKENVVPMTGSIDRLKALKPSRFNFITDPNTTVDGFLAHEAQEIVPEAISGEKDAMTTEKYEVTPALGEVFIPAVEEVTTEQQVMETVEGDTYVNLAGETITETSEVSVTEEVTTTVIERQEIDGVMTEVEVEKVTQEPVMETVVTTEAVAEVILESNVEKPEELTDGQQWRETTPAVMGEREVPDMQGIDQAKLTPLLTSALQEAVAKIEELEARLATAGIA